MYWLHVVPGGITLTEVPSVDSSAFYTKKKIRESTPQKKGAPYSGRAVRAHVDPRMEHLLYEENMRDLGL